MTISTKAVMPIPNHIRLTTRLLLLDLESYRLWGHHTNKVPIAITDPIVPLWQKLAFIAIASSICDTYDAIILPYSKGTERLVVPLQDIDKIRYGGSEKDGIYAVTEYGIFYHKHYWYSSTLDRIPEKFQTLSNIPLNSTATQFFGGYKVGSYSVQGSLIQRIGYDLLSRKNHQKLSDFSSWEYSSESSYGSISLV